MQTYSIGEAARQLGLAPSALRYYEQQGIIPAPERVHGRRRYSDAALRAIVFVQYAQRAGFRLAEIRRLLQRQNTAEAFGDAWRVMAHHKLVELDAHITQLQQMQRQLTNSLTCGCQTVIACPRLQTPQTCREA